MIIGCVKEIKNNEYRVGLTPDNVHACVAHGHQVWIETQAGAGSGFSDEQYQQAGARIAPSAAAVWQTCEIMVKVKEPLASEYGYFRPGLIIYTYFHLAADPQLTEELLKQGVTAVAYETLEVDHHLPLLMPMSRIAGRLSIQEGAKYLEKPFGGSGVLLAGVPGTRKGNVLILGGGTVGTNACRIAVGIGANVTIMDVNLDRLAQLDDLFGAQIQTMYSTDANIAREIRKADLVVGSVLIPGRSAPKLIKKSYLKTMRPGSVIVDVAIDQGGSAETSRVTTHDQPIFCEDGIIHYCVGNMPGVVPYTSTVALTNATEGFLLKIADQGLAQACRNDPDIYSGINTYDGHVTYRAVAESLDREYRDIHTLMP
jgi:alanine dehydrogenase